MIRHLLLLQSFSANKLPRPFKPIDVTRTAPSILLEQQSTSSSFAIQKLSPAQKKSLGLFIVKPPFNPRMSVQKQLEYLPTLTTDLYKRQAQQLTPKVRILEQPKEEKKVDMLKLTTLIYKDIYARYLVARGIGVRWEGGYAQNGMMNPDVGKGMSDLYKTYLNVYDQVYIKKVPSLFSISKNKQVPVESATIQTIKLIGQGVLFDIVSYGKYEKEFKPLLEKNGKISFILFVPEFWSLPQMKAVCVKAEQPYIVLKKANSQTYYITASQHYKNHRDWFTKQEFVKHLFVNGKEFEGMKVKALDGSNVPVILDLEEYDRQYGSRIYPVVPAHNIADYERGKEYKLSISTKIGIDGALNHPQYGENVNIQNPDINEIIKQKLKESGLLLNLSDLCEEEAFLSPQKDILRMIPLQKLYLSTNDKAKNTFLQKMQKQSTITESKIQIPKMDRQLRGKYRRRFRKKVEKLLQQRTQYYSLEQSLKFGEICISTFGDCDFPIPVFERRNSFVMPNKARQRILEISSKRPLTGHDIQQFSQPLCKTKIFHLSKQFIRACFFLCSDEHPLDRVIIQPQLSTQSLLPYALTVAAVTHQAPPKLIKLHPTLKLYESMDTDDLVLGVVKLNEERQYGFGFDALRMWVAERDNQKGDRVIKEKQVNQQITHAQVIRKVYWKILGYLKEVDPKVLEGLATAEVPFFDQFMYDQIDYFIKNMQKSYNKMTLSLAHSLTIDFYKNIVEEIYLKSITKKLIAFPKQYLPRLLVFKRLLECLAVVSPLIPFSCMHVSQTQYMRWPDVNETGVSSTAVDFYNKLIRFRTELRNRLVLNKMTNCLVYIKKMEMNIPEKELALFLNVEEVTYKEPKGVAFRFKEDERFDAKVYDYYNTCYRCDPISGNKEYLCGVCNKYLQDYSIKLIKS